MGEHNWLKPDDWDGDLPAEEKVEQIGDFLGAVLTYVHDELKSQGALTEDAFMAATVILKVELERGSQPFSMVVSFPDSVKIAQSLMRSAIEHVDALVEQRERADGQG